MIPRSALLGLLAAAIAVQLAVPATMVLRREQTLRRGVAFRFETAPVDPWDAFRGRYVAVQVASNDVPCATEFRRNQRVHVRVEAQTNGFARLVAVAARAGDEGTWFRARVSYMHAGNVSLQLPFDRFYMDEESAPAAEQAYREANRRGAPGAQTAWLVVRVHRGQALVEDLYVGGRPIREVLDTEPAK